jgi:predicted nuclease with TOPRIM domain
LDGEVKTLRGEVQELRGEVRRLDGEVKTLRGDVHHLRGDSRQLLTDLQEGFHRLNAQDELTAGTVVMMASVLRRPTDLGEDLEKRLRELQPH